MGVFPAASKDHIPKPFHFLMTDSRSPIIDFYPLEFPIDLNGKKFAWQGVALLPFIDANRLLKEIEPLYHKLTADEKHRNSLGNEILFESQEHSTFESLCAIYTKEGNPKFNLDTAKAGDLGGSVSKDPNVCLPGGIYHSPLIEFNLLDIENKQSISVAYHMPTIPKDHIFRAVLLRNAEIPGQILNDEDRHAIRMGYTSRGRGGRGGGNNRGRGAAQRMIRHGLAIPKSQVRDSGRFGGDVDEYGRQRRSDYGASDRGQDTQRRQPYPGGYDNDRSHDNRRYDQGRSDYSARNDQSRQDRSQQPYMGGGGYANRDANGKYQVFYR